MTIDEMIEELEQTYEAAGFANFYEKILKNKSEEEIISIYNEYKKSFEESKKDYQKEIDS